MYGFIFVYFIRTTLCKLVFGNTCLFSATRRGLVGENQTLRLNSDLEDIHMTKVVRSLSTALPMICEYPPGMPETEVRRKFADNTLESKREQETEPERNERACGQG